MHQVGVRKAFGSPGRKTSLLYFLHGGASVIKLPDQEMRISSLKHLPVFLKTSKRNPPVGQYALLSCACKGGHRSCLSYLSLAAERCLAQLERLVRRR